MKFLCHFGHKFEVEKKVKGQTVKGVVDQLKERGVFILYKCKRCGYRYGEFVSLTKTTPVMPDFIDAYSLEIAESNAKDAK